MLDLKLIRENPEEVARRLRTRGEEISLARLLELDEQRRAIIREAEELKARRNEGSKEIGRLLATGREEEARLLKAEMARLAEQIRALDEHLGQAEQELRELLIRLPNLPHRSVPVSAKKGDKVVLREHKEKPSFSFPVRSHIALGEALGLLDLPRGAQIAGARFPLYRGRGALLELGLVQFMLRYQAEENGYEPIFPPFLGNEESLFVSSQLPKFQEDLYFCERDGLYLNPTAEVLLANIHRGEILQAEELPKKYAAFTTCFRREAGAAGEEERGLIRVHQFNKVELFWLSKPEESYEALEQLIRDAEDILKELDLHYRVTLLPTCDLAQQAAKTVDLEVWLPSQGKYYEVSSCSNCEDYQARRGNIRYRPEPGAKPEFVHMLNGSGVATSRLFAAILENNQQPDGSVVLPEPLRDYVGADVLK
ncbi:MAG: serine--tRNA ligase [Candidatus Acetothermia bacterium]|nr:serine--tRNA ligase [Candidatus Acetothermia bacterium]MDH7505779.1 serine--tRNA ligase [Candidatus Acetothermia bacterium]